jgi:hypothetical protein
VIVGDSGGSDGAKERWPGNATAADNERGTVVAATSAVVRECTSVGSVDVDNAVDVVVITPPAVPNDDTAADAAAVGADGCDAGLRTPSSSTATTVNVYCNVLKLHTYRKIILIIIIIIVIVTRRRTPHAQLVDGDDGERVL